MNYVYQLPPPRGSPSDTGADSGAAKIAGDLHRPPTRGGVDQPQLAEIITRQHRPCRLVHFTRRQSPAGYALLPFLATQAAFPLEAQSQRVEAPNLMILCRAKRAGSGIGGRLELVYPIVSTAIVAMTKGVVRVVGTPHERSLTRGCRANAHAAPRIIKK
jgi:hypothetical protein